MLKSADDGTALPTLVRLHTYDIFIGDPAEFFASENCIPHGATQSVHIVVDEFAGAVFAGGLNNHPIVGSPVAIDADGKLGVQASSARFKTDIEPIGKASEAILALQPVAFRYKQEIDPKKAPQFGFVAEDVEKVNPDLVARDKHGKPYTVRYDAVNAMLLNEFIKGHRRLEEQEVGVTELKAMLQKQQAANVGEQKQIEALTVGLQKVTAQLEVDTHAHSVVTAAP